VCWLLWAVLGVEALWLLARGRPPSVVLAATMPGVLFVAALYAALTGAAWPWIAAALAGAGVAHCVDLRVRGRLV